MRVAGANHGFSLLETLVAFSIAAAALGVILQIYAKGTSAVILAGDYAHAIAIAESRMAEFSVVDDSVDHITGVVGEKYYWSIQSGDYHDESPAELDSPLRLRQVDVEVRWEDRGRARSIRLHTLKPAPGGPGGPG